LLTGGYVLSQPAIITSELPQPQAVTEEHSVFSLRYARAGLRVCVEALIEHVIGWYQTPEAWRGEPPQMAIKITTGAGKSEALRRVIPIFIAEAKRLGLPHRVIFFVPTHKLADEARLKMPDGISTELWQGRGATLPGTTDPLCNNLEAVGAALKMGANVSATVCAKRKIKCQFYETCGYQRQKPRVHIADVVLAAHDILFQQKPLAFGKGFGLIITDESFWERGISRGARLNISSLLRDLKEFPVIDRKTGAINGDHQARFVDITTRLVRAFEVSEDGYVSKAQLLAHDLLPTTMNAEGSFASAVKYEWRRKVDPKLGPDAPLEERQTAAEKLKPLGRIRLRVALWRALDELLTGAEERTGRVRLEVEDDARYVRVLGRKEISKSFAGLPHIHADATMSLGIVKYYLPRIGMALDVDVETPHMTVTQVIGKSVGKRWLTIRKGSQYVEETKARQQQHVDLVKHLAKGRRGVTITYKGFDEVFREIENMDAAHFGAIEGLDQWGDVQVLTAIGRPLPSQPDIEGIAAALTGNPIIAPEMTVRERAINLKNGAAYLLPCRVYESPEAEMVRRAVSETAVEQAVGRARGVNRTSDTPVDVYVVLDDSVTSLPVDEVVEFDVIKPDRFDEMVVRGLVPEFSADAAALYPDLFKTEIAARMAYHRRAKREAAGESVSSPYKNLLISARNTLREVRYKPAAARSKPRSALYSPTKTADPRAVIEAAVGPLASFEVVPVSFGVDERAEGIKS
jgi:hypothetical protein